MNYLFCNAFVNEIAQESQPRFTDHTQRYRFTMRNCGSGLKKKALNSVTNCMTEIQRFPDMLFFEILPNNPFLNLH